MINVIIIDDSRLARNELKRLLASNEKINIIGEAANAEQAKILVEEKKPDLIFLDIQMPGKSGFDLLEELEYFPKVIFTTAYDEFALKAFEYNALDYLLKPIEKSRLADSLIKFETPKSESEKPEKYIGNQFFIKDGKNCWFINLEEIKYFEVEGNYTKVFFEDKSPLLNRTLSHLEERLDPTLFFKANRKQIINIKWIKSVDNWFNGSLKVKLKDETEIEISRRQAVKFKEIMSF